MFPEVAFQLHVIMKLLFTYGCHPMASNYERPVPTTSVMHTLLILTLKTHGFKGIVL